MVKLAEETGPDRLQAAARRELFRVCAEATEAELRTALAACGDLPEIEDIRPPEAGLVMLRGRIGADGQPFNVGEATVTRAAIRLRTGALGFAYILGRAPGRARLAAVVDALGQERDWRERLEAVLVRPVMTRRAAETARAREETAATRASFFTLVRGED